VKIPTGEMFVKFKSDATAEQIQTQLQDLKLRVVELPARPNSAYKVTQTPTSAAHSLETVDSLKRLSTVEYAEPNWLIVRLEEP
jgi:fervidolysin-like protein